MAQVKHKDGTLITWERERLDRGGYTSGGRYFGIGAPLYRVEVDDGQTWREYYIRASGQKDVRDLAKRGAEAVRMRSTRGTP